MEPKIIVMMATTIKVNKDSHLYRIGELTPNDLRLKQYIQGFETFFEFNKNNSLNVIVADNSTYLWTYSPLKSYLLGYNTTIVPDAPNLMGGINKGAGVLETLKWCTELLDESDYIIYFEPRQILCSNQFIESVLKNPCNLFSGGQSYFNTGLFCIKKTVLFDFLRDTPPETLIENESSLEYVLYDYFENNNIPFQTIEKMDLNWYDSKVKTYKLI